MKCLLNINLYDSFFGNSILFALGIINDVYLLIFRMILINIYQLLIYCPK